MKIPVIFENKDFLAIDKPAGLLSEPTERSKEETIVDFLKNRYKENKSFDPVRFGLLHRLDRETSGILLVAKNKEAFVYFKDLFKKREIKKEYLALVYGWLNKRKGIIDFPLGWGGYFRTTASKARNKKSAITEYQVLKKLQGGEKYTLLKVEPKTGRTNQIRIHLARIGFPIVGDKLYGRKKRIPEECQKLKRHFLHASALTFTFKKTRYRLESVLPLELKEFLEKELNFSFEE